MILLQDFVRVQRVLRHLAEAQNLTVRQVRRWIQEAIDEAWVNSRGDPAAKAKWDTYFPDGHKPTLEEFMVHLGNQLSAGEDPPYLLK